PRRRPGPDGPHHGHRPAPAGPCADASHGDDHRREGDTPVSEPLTEDRRDDDTGWVEPDLDSDSDTGSEADLDADLERQPGFPPDGLVTLRYLWDAVRRHAHIWIATAVLGLVAGLAFPFVLPPPAVATTKLLLTHRSGDDPAQAIATDVRLATTDTVARRVIRDLGLREEPNDLLKRYT